MNHTERAINAALDRLKREVNILCEMRERPLALYDPDGVHVRLILAQSKKVRNCSNMLVRAIARERDEQQPHPEGWSDIVRPMVRDNNAPLQP